MNCRRSSSIAQGFRHGRKQRSVLLPFLNRKTKGKNEFVINELKIQPASKPAEVIILLTCIRKVLVSNLDWYTDYSDVFRVFLSSSRQMTKIITTRRYRSTSHGKGKEAKISPFLIKHHAMNMYLQVKI